MVTMTRRSLRIDVREEDAAGLRPRRYLIFSIRLLPSAFASTPVTDPFSMMNVMIVVESAVPSAYEFPGRNTSGCFSLPGGVTYSSPFSSVTSKVRRGRSA